MLIFLMTFPPGQSESRRWLNWRKQLKRKPKTMKPRSRRSGRGMPLPWRSSLNSLNRPKGWEENELSASGVFISAMGGGVVPSMIPELRFSMITELSCPLKVHHNCSWDLSCWFDNIAAIQQHVCAVSSGHQHQSRQQEAQVDHMAPVLVQKENYSNTAKRRSL